MKKRKARNIVYVPAKTPMERQRAMFATFLDRCMEDEALAALQDLDNLDAPLPHLDEPALIVATGKGLRRVVEALIVRGASLAVHAQNGLTLMQFAACNGDADFIRLFAEAGCPVNGPDANGDSPLRLAILFGNTDCARVLMELGADSTTRTDGGETMLHSAAFAVNADLIEDLLAKGLDVNAPRGDGATALMLVLGNEVGNNIAMFKYCHTDAETCEAARMRALQLLLDAGADIHVRNSQDHTPLSVSLFLQRPDAANYLLDHGADPMQRANDDDPLPVCMLAAQPSLSQERLALLDRLLGLSGDVATMRVAGIPVLSVLLETACCPEAFRKFIEAGALAQVQDADTMSILSQAVRAGRGDLVRVLLACGEDPNEPSLLGQYPLQLALGSNADCLRALLDGGADPFLCLGEDGMTLPEFALKYWKMASRFENGALPSTKDRTKMLKMLREITPQKPTDW